MAEPIYLPTAWSTMSVLPTVYSLGPAPTSDSGITIDDVANMDNVMTMDTLEETP